MAKKNNRGRRGFVGIPHSSSWGGTGHPRRPEIGPANLVGGVERETARICARCRNIVQQSSTAGILCSGCRKKELAEGEEAELARHATQMLQQQEDMLQAHEEALQAHEERERMRALKMSWYKKPIEEIEAIAWEEYSEDLLRGQVQREWCERELAKNLPWMKGEWWQRDRPPFGYSGDGDLWLTLKRFILSARTRAVLMNKIHDEAQKEWILRDEENKDQNLSMDALAEKNYRKMMHKKYPKLW